MGNIQWKALPIAEAMDEIDKLIAEAGPFLEKAKGIAMEAGKQPGLPQYMDWDIRGVWGEIDSVIHRLKSQVDRCRRDLPADALARERRRAETPTLV